MHRVQGVSSDFAESVHFVQRLRSLLIATVYFSRSVAVLQQYPAVSTVGTVDALCDIILNLSLRLLVRQKVVGFDQVVKGNALLSLGR